MMEGREWLEEGTLNDRPGEWVYSSLRREITTPRGAGSGLKGYMQYDPRQNGRITF